MAKALEEVSKDEELTSDQEIASRVATVASFTVNPESFHRPTTPKRKSKDIKEVKKRKGFVSMYDLSDASNNDTDSSFDDERKHKKKTIKENKT